MSISPVLLGVIAYVGLLVLALGALAAAKRGDEAMARAVESDPERMPVRLPEGRPPVQIEAASDPARRLAADVVGALGVERVIVLLDRPDGCAVAACGGVPGVLGTRVPAAAGADGTEGARVLMRRSAAEGPPLSVASVPIEAEGRSLGAVAVGTRRLTPRDLDFLRRVVARAARNIAGAGELDAA